MQVSRAHRPENAADATVVPFSVEYERAVLGALLLDQAAWNAVCELIGDIDFHLDVHKKIFGTIREIAEQGGVHDIVTVYGKLSDTELVQVGGLEYLRQLATAPVSPANIEVYAEHLRRFTQRRKLAQVADQLSSAARYVRSEPIDELISDATRSLADIASDGPTPPPATTIELRQACAIAATPARATWLYPRFIERMAMILMFGGEGTLKSFLALHWSLEIALTGQVVLYLSAEGRGMWKRLRAWAIACYPHTPWATALKAVPFFAIEQPLNLSCAATIARLQAVVSTLPAVPALIVVDTVGRNSDGLVERSNEDTLGYINGLDRNFRNVYRCAVLLTHHTGHSAKDRARGPISLTQATDANFFIERPNLEQLSIIVRSGRMKDSAPPPPIQYEAQVVLIDELDENGKPESSLILREVGIAAATQRTAPKGKHQAAMLAAIQEHFRTVTTDMLTSEDWRAIGKAQAVPRQRFKEVEDALCKFGWLKPSVGGWRFLRDPE